MDKVTSLVLPKTDGHFMPCTLLRGEVLFLGIGGIQDRKLPDDYKGGISVLDVIFIVIIIKID